MNERTFNLNLVFAISQEYDGLTINPDAPPVHRAYGIIARPDSEREDIEVSQDVQQAREQLCLDLVVYPDPFTGIYAGLHTALLKGTEYGVVQPNFPYFTKITFKTREGFGPTENPDAYRTLAKCFREYIRNA